eukprot:gnl/Chilomastix_caulleri/5874.p1 GENE.gnl/Chilomastix_caulleri/5874~~gnl/Chilomastix_caulleri/5874.p1  ORF type:complete len:70 (+),score=13.95 gnl/Chilomastix_caulleri/5874:99-308(+)
MNVPGYTDKENLELSTKLLSVNTNNAMVEIDLRKAKEENVRLVELVRIQRDKVRGLESELKMLRSTRGI